MENNDLKRLPDPNTYQYDIFVIAGIFEAGVRSTPETTYYKHFFRDEKGNVTAHWSKKRILPENASLDDL